MGKGQIATISYVGSAGRKLTAECYYNIASVNSAFSLGNGLYIVNNSSTSDYDALQASYQCRLMNGLQMLASFTWAHNIGDESNNVLVSVQKRSNLDNDVRKNFQAAATYGIPGGTRIRFRRCA